MTPLPLTAVFDDLPDPHRDTRNKHHRLTDILTIATCAVIGGAESWEATAEDGRTKADFFRRSLPLDNGIPSPDTFERVFAKLAPGAFAGAFGRWMAAACEATDLIPIAIDGKSARRAKKNTATGCLTMVSAWATENRLTLGQVAVTDGSNEIGAIPELLRSLDLSGAIVAIDAAGCQVENARIIRQQEGHYLLAVEDNQPTLRAAVERVVDEACEADFIGVAMDGDEATDDAHGRHEERYVTVIGEPAGIPADWPDVAAVVQVNREREVTGERTVTTHYYLTSYAGTAADLGRWVRGHWGIENGLHWVLDVVFREYSGPRKLDHRLSYSDGPTHGGSDGEEAEGPLGGVQGPGRTGGSQGGRDDQRAGRPARRPPDAHPRLEEAPPGRGRGALRRAGRRPGGLG